MTDSSVVMQPARPGRRRRIKLEQQVRKNGRHEIPGQQAARQDGAGLMPREHEAKILNVEPGAIEGRILANGGRHVCGPVLMRRLVYDITPGDESRWLRLRASGEVTTLAVKRIVHEGIDGVEEIEVRVGDFDVMNEILIQLGLTPKSYQENRRTSYALDGAEVNIDEWPLLPPYLEIESSSREGVIRVAAILGYTEDLLSSLNTLSVYAASGLNLLAYRRLTFDDAQKSARGEL